MTSRLDSFIGHPVLDPNGTKVGTLEDFYKDDRTGRTLWLKVKLRRFGRGSRFVSVTGSEPRGSDVVIAFPRAGVRRSPVAGRDGPLTTSEDGLLRAYYGGVTRA